MEWPTCLKPCGPTGLHRRHTNLTLLAHARALMQPLLLRTAVTVQVSARTPTHPVAPWVAPPPPPPPCASVPPRPPSAAPPPAPWPSCGRRPQARGQPRTSPAAGEDGLASHERGGSSTTRRGPVPRSRLVALTNTPHRRRPSHPPLYAVPASHLHQHPSHLPPAPRATRSLPVSPQAAFPLFPPPPPLNPHPPTSVSGW